MLQPSSATSAESGGGGSVLIQKTKSEKTHGISTTEGFSRNRPARISLRRLETELGQRSTEKIRLSLFENGQSSVSVLTSYG